MKSFLSIYKLDDFAIKISLLKEYSQYLLIKVINYIEMRQLKTMETQNVFEICVNNLL